MNPSPAPPATASPPHRWAILRHDFPWLHWDLLVARPNAPAATTWRLLRTPCINEPIAAQALPDHRLVYLDYEGPVSGGRGSVQRLHGGEWQEMATDSNCQPATHPAPTAGPALQLLLHVQFLGCSRFSAGKLTRTTDGRLFWTFTSVLSDVVCENDSPLVPAENSC
ncbi:MAG: hypothetical protein ACKOEO_15450 [Planctomycetaceae bacterium]